MQDKKEAVLLRIYVKENDTYEGRPLYLAIAEEARKQGLAGATVLRGVAGYGSSKREGDPESLSAEVPVVVEIVDWEDRAEAFAGQVSSMMERGLVTTETVRVLWYQSAGSV